MNNLKISTRLIVLIGLLSALLPDARYIEVPGTHMGSVTKPDLGSAIVAFLAA